MTIREPIFLRNQLIGSEKMEAAAQSVYKASLCSCVCVCVKCVYYVDSLQSVPCCTWRANLDSYISSTHQPQMIQTLPAEMDPFLLSSVDWYQGNLRLAPAEFRP